MLRSGAVAIESLYQRTPFNSRTNSKRCGTPRKLFRRFEHRIQRETGRMTDGKRGQHVLHVMVTAQLDLFAQYQRQVGISIAQVQQTIMQVCAIQSFIEFVQAEREQFTLHHFPQTPCTFIIMPEDGHIIF